MSAAAYSTESPSVISAEAVEAGSQSPALASGIRRGDRRPDEQFTVDLFDRPLTIGGSFESFLEFQGDISFDDADDDLTFIDHSLSIEFFYEISESTSFFADFALFYSKDDADRLTGAERNQTWLLLEEIFNSDFDIKIGAQYFSDERAWWWDEDLDGISIQYWGERWQGELGFTQGLARKSTTEDHLDPADENLFRLLSRVSWEFSDEHWMEFFYVVQNDHSGTEGMDAILDTGRLDDTDADLRWFGIRSYGYWEMDRTGEIDYWLDAGYVNGDETFISTSEVDGVSGQLLVDDVETFVVRGWAIDLGLTWHTAFPLSPSFTLGYAVGSGKLDEEGFLDYAYQQTGIEGNSNYFTDVNIVSYYGELLNPELSNLKILTLGVSVPLLDNTALDLIYHQYDQYKRADFLRNAGIDIDPTGNSKRIGKEIDIILGVQESVHWEYGFIAAFFKAGDAFENDSGELATSLQFQLNYNF